MIRGLFINLHFPYGTFLCYSASADQFIHIILDAQEQKGVDFLLYSYHTVNRQFFKLLDNQTLLLNI